MTAPRIPESLILSMRKYFPVLAAIAGVSIVVLFYDTFGTAWDDYLQARHGENCLDFYLSLGRDRSFLQFENMYLYGSLFEVFSAALHRILNEADIFRYRGLLCGLTALLAAALTICLVNRYERRAFGWFAGLFLLTSTQFWGQAFVNSKDIPFLAAYLAWWYCYLAWSHGGFKKNRWLVLSGFALGLVLGSRIGGIPLLGFTVGAGFTGWILKGRAEQLSWRHILLCFPWVNHLLVLMGGWIVMILIWPTALLNPFSNPFEAFFTFLMFPWRILVSFHGSIINADALPRYAFVLEHFLAQPLWCYPLYAAGCVALFRKWQTRDPAQRMQCISIGFWVLPLFLIFFIKPFSFYNGVRQSLFLWPAYAWLAAIGLHQLYLWLGRFQKRKLWTATAGAALIFCNVSLLLSQHPFNYTYRNPVVRLLPGGINGFDSDYHALSYRLAAQYMDRISLERLVAHEPAPSILVVADRYGAFAYSRFAEFAEFAPGSRFHYELSDDTQILQFEYIVILRNLMKKSWMFRPFYLGKCEIEHQIQTNGQIHTTIYRRIENPESG